MIFQPIHPMLISLHSEAFDDDSYLFEPKWDGWRIQIHKLGNRIEAYTRQGRCVTCKFPELLHAISNIHARDVILDCEGICLQNGRAIFDDFSYRGRLTDEYKINHASRTHPATFIAFDVLFAEGRTCMNEPLMQRKKRLYDIVHPSSVITPSLHVEGQGLQLKRLTEERNWEGIVAKKKSSLYIPDTRTQEWLKIKNWKTIDVVILGYRTTPRFGMIVGLHFPTMHNKPVGIVENGFTDDEIEAFLRSVPDLHTFKDRQAQWIEPRLCCQVQYLDRTDRHQLRTILFKGFTFKKDPDECVWVC